MASRIVQYFADKLRTVKDYPITVEKAIYDENGVRLDNKLLEIKKASNSEYDNTESGLKATNVQGAVDELNSSLATFFESIGYDPNSIALIPAMTSDTTPSGVASASTCNTNVYAYNAFDRSDTTYWASSVNNGLNSWVQYKFSNPKVFKKIEIQPLVSSGTARVKQFKLQASNDGNTWTQLLSGTCQNSNTVQSFTLDSTTAYQYIRLLIVDHYGATSEVSGVRKMQVYG